MDRSSLRRRVLPVLIAALVMSPETARAVPLRSGFGGPTGYGLPEHCLAPSDDGSAPIDLTGAFSDGLRLFGPGFRSAFINVDGAVTFLAPLGPFTASSVPQMGRPMIAPWYADADTRGGGQPLRNNVCYHLEPERLVVTWNNVGAHDASLDRLDDFQLIVTARRRCVLYGDADIELRYNRCAWTAGLSRAPGEPDQHALVGLDAGNLRNYVVVPRSRTPEIARMCDDSNVPGGAPGLWRFVLRSSDLIGLCAGYGTDCRVPDRVGLCARGVYTCDEGVHCVSRSEALDERCNNLDDDCDGVVDEGAPCPEGRACRHGACVLPCDAGACGASDCEAAPCPEGTRCSAGACVDACDGVRCPPGQRCTAGRCVAISPMARCIPRGILDPDTGLCVDDCACVGCPSGEVCLAEGRCVHEACAGVVCPPGHACRVGRCVDRCDLGTEPVACPMGERCRAGECIPVAALPPPSTADAATTRDAASVDGVGEDVRADDVRDDAERPRTEGPRAAGCACGAAHTRDGDGVAWLVLAACVRRRRAAPTSPHPATARRRSR